jgi:site-specific DNA-methyltransferase (adenine-specific)
MSTTELHHGDCLEVLASMRSDSVAAIVTDPPYGLSFMGRKWDYDVPSTEIWEQCLRVLKPGGHLLAFAGTRTQHRMCVNIEEAGFEIRDMIAWVYGSGFPKGKSCLKPALEPITMARKHAKHVQPLNIDGCRVGDDTGRWPANLIHDGSDEVTQLFPEAGGGFGKRGASRQMEGWGMGGNNETVGFGDSGSAARFFYCPKANKKDREDGNTHPTVKPTDLMAYLCRLVTPPGGTVLDPFMGSGSTGKAAIREGFGFIGIERDADYYAICQSRINGAQIGLALAV